MLIHFSPGLPKIIGNFTELQEVFFNLIDNAYDAMMQRKEELKEDGYRPTIEIKAEPRGNKWINIVLRDNGIGIKLEDQNKIFTPFFTTKLSSKKGTGLGLYVIRKLIEENHKGKVIYRSEYMKGTRVYVTLPTC
jgi:signal transduction histidine kinase